MKVLALLLSLCMSLNLMAASGSTEALSQALDEYQYAITVEWDQKDQAFYQKETNAFFEKIGTAVVEGGLSKEAILALAEKKMGNKKSFEALKLKLALTGDVKSPEQLAKFLQENSKEFYQSGASWNGSIDWVSTGLIVGLIALVAYSVWFSVTHECVESEERYSCSDTTSCIGYDSYGSCNWWETRENCGWTDVCTRWEKK